MHFLSVSYPLLLPRFGVLAAPSTDVASTATTVSEALTSADGVDNAGRLAAAVGTMVNFPKLLRFGLGVLNSTSPAYTAPYRSLAGTII